MMNLNIEPIIVRLPLREEHPHLLGLLDLTRSIVDEVFLGLDLIPEIIGSNRVAHQDEE
jgi:hypothetical protein